MRIQVIYSHLCNTIMHTYSYRRRRYAACCFGSTRTHCPYILTHSHSSSCTYAYSFMTLVRTFWCTTVQDVTGCNICILCQDTNLLLAAVGVAFRSGRWQADLNVHALWGWYSLCIVLHLMVRESGRRQQLAARTLSDSSFSRTRRTPKLCQSPSF